MEFEILCCGHLPSTTQASLVVGWGGGRREEKERPLFGGFSSPPAVALLLSFSLPLRVSNVHVHTVTLIRHVFQQTVASDNFGLHIVLNKTEEFTSFIFTAFLFFII